MMNENLCPVCGYELEAPPKDYRICPSCGTEFGVNDVNATISDLREAWMNTGPRWWSRTDSIPDNWDPIAQMERAGIAVKRQPTSEPMSVSTSTSTVRVGNGRNVSGWVAAAPSGQYGDRSHVMEPR
jgi:hypothetical protein